ncbi:Ribonuclease BN, tRNA processing enzyme [Modestobacter sp. DSM 44400]|uniref:MBL fold metallo-hydrolase n=1 Tax=Modestobacter sp. DSM 44400 TaxID=1550230 RepID=UPI00089B98E2|nr:MBL fold metallo-hydrolase [Modestobacter sp. DSM 44400]SDY36497.1 Ribonuclease BN, tRNA processing enzyme [Modestobacter sp. DSM 44400]
MRLTVVGCSGSAPGPVSPASCYLVEQDGFSLVLDLGNGAFGSLLALSDPASVDAVYLSHLHADHCLDVAPFIVWHRYSGQSAPTAVPLYAPVGADRRLSVAYGPDDGSIEDVFDVTPIGPGTWALGPFEVSTARTAHPVECYAVRLTAGGRSLVYTGDTGPSEAVVALARGADVLLSEAAFPEAPDLPPGLHLTGRQAGEHAAAAGVGRLLITHVPAWVDADTQLAAAREVFPAAELARHAAVYDI